MLVVQHSSHLHFFISTAAETFPAELFQLPENKKLKSYFRKLKLCTSTTEKEMHGALLNNCAMFAINQGHSLQEMF